MRYFVSEIRDDSDLLRCELEGLGQGGGRIVSVIWQPPRRTFVEGKEIDRSSGYVIVSEFESNPPHQHEIAGKRARVRCAYPEKYRWQFGSRLDGKLDQLCKITQFRSEKQSTDRIRYVTRNKSRPHAHRAALLRRITCES
jgi:hypothetical protein